jgi:hypothetical protein
MSVSSFVRTTPHLQSECDRAFSEGRLRTAGQPNSLGTVAISLANLEGGSGVAWRGIGNTKFAVAFNSGSRRPFYARTRYCAPAYDISLRYDPLRSCLHGRQTIGSRSKVGAE